MSHQKQKVRSARPNKIVHLKRQKAKGKKRQLEQGLELVARKRLRDMTAQQAVLKRFRDYR